MFARTLKHCPKVSTFALMLALLAAPAAPRAGHGGGHGVTITAAYVPGANALDPDDPSWNQAAPATVTLQRFIDYVADSGGGMGGMEGGMGDNQCMMMGDSIDQPITMRAVHNGSEIFFRYEWSDSTSDTSVNDTDVFADALAMEIPYGGTGDTSLAMGSQTEPVNIIFWRADLSQPQNIVGGGIGTPQPSPDAQNLQHYQDWANDTWTVIVSRPMAGASDNQVTLESGTSYDVAFANWDGSDLNRDGRKAFTNWNTLDIE